LVWQWWDRACALNGRRIWSVFNSSEVGCVLRGGGLQKTLYINGSLQRFGCEGMRIGGIWSMLGLQAGRARPPATMDRCRAQILPHGRLDPITGRRTLGHRLALSQAANKVVSEHPGRWPCWSQVMCGMDERSRHRSVRARQHFAIQGGRTWAAEAQ
jgi:hypothetical protein